MGMESMGKSIMVDRSCRRSGCDGLVGEGEREMEMEMEEHTGIEKEGNEEKVKEEEEGHAAVIFQGSTYLFFSCFFLGFFWGVLSKVPVCIMHACMYAGNKCCLVIYVWSDLERDWCRNICGGCFF